MRRFISLAVLSIVSACDISESIPELQFFLNKEWRAEKVTVNGQTQDDKEVSNYRISLKDDFTFEETYFDGSLRMGEWSLDNNATILVLSYDTGYEIEFLIIEVQIRQLVLRALRSNDKIGSGSGLDILYYLVPVRA